MNQLQNNFSLRSDFGIRLVASLMDLFIVSVLAFLFVILGVASLFTGLALSSQYAAGNSFTAGAFAGGGLGTLIAMAGLAYLVVLLYGLIEAFTGASPGKRMLGLQIAYENGTKGNMNLYLKRWAIKNIGSLLSLIGAISWIGRVYNFMIFIGCFFALGEKRQALHDVWAKTAVFRKKDIISAENISA